MIEYKYIYIYIERERERERERDENYLFLVRNIWLVNITCIKIVKNH